MKDINAGIGASYPDGLTAVGGTLYFIANDGIHGRELWKSDGTAAGTVMVADIAPGAASSSPDSLTDAQGTLFFSASDGIHGRELWKSDGTAAGTSMVQDINAGSEGSLPSNLANIQGRLVFAASDGQHGMELWRSDGTAAGTSMVQDIAPGRANSNPASFTLLGDRVLFSADDGSVGDELWAIPLSELTAAPPPLPGTPIPIGDIPSSGGSATSNDKVVDLTFPTGAVSNTIMLSYTRLLTPSHALGRDWHAIESFVLQGRSAGGQEVTHFLQPYTLIVHYTDAQLAALDTNAANLNVLFWNGNAWVPILPCARCYVDAANHQVVLVLDHFTEFALVGSPDRMLFLPIMMR